MLRINSIYGGLLLLLLWTSSGCQLLNNAKLASLPEATIEHPVVEIICVWQPGEGTGTDGLPCRGFAGQVLFFAMGEKAPVRVNGKVRVYVFDDQGTEAEQELPIHQFDFDAVAFQNFLTNTNMGAAYQLFIPYTRKGTHAATCTLRVRYTPEEGSRVYSKMASLNLPGTSPRKPDEPIDADIAKRDRDAQIVSDLLQPASHEEEKSGDQITLASATTEAVTSNEDKRRLRSTLTQISRISPATPSHSPSVPTDPSALPPPSRSFKLHPLAENAPATSSVSQHPLSESAVPTPAPTPTDAEKTAAKTPVVEKTTVEKSVSEQDVSQEKPAPISDTPQAESSQVATSPAEQGAAPARHPLQDD